jgi:hypothetical protein
MYLRCWVLALLMFSAASCSVDFDDENMHFFCVETSDCGGDGFVCISPEDGVGVSYCCKDEGEEICGDEKDNNCDGRVNEGCT